MESEAALPAETGVKCWQGEMQDKCAEQPAWSISSLCERCPEAHSAPWFPRSWTHRGEGDEDSAEHGGCVRDNVVLESGAILCHSTHTADLLLTAHRITGFAEWEGTHKHHQVQLLGLHRTIPKSSTTCPRMLSKHSSSIRIGAVTILGSLFQCPASNPLGKEPLSNVHPTLSPGFVSAVQHRGTGISCWPHCDWDKPGCPRPSWLSSQQSSHYIAGYRAKLKSTASTGKRSTMDGPPADKHNHPITFTRTPFLGVILVLDAGRPFSVLSTHPCTHTQGASKPVRNCMKCYTRSL